MTHLQTSLHTAHVRSLAGSCCRSTSREGSLEKLWNKLLLASCGQDSMCVVDECRTNQRLPLNGGERTFGEYGCQLFCGACMVNTNGTVQIDSLKIKPYHINTVSS